MVERFFIVKAIWDWRWVARGDPPQETDCHELPSALGTMLGYVGLKGGAATDRAVRCRCKVPIAQKTLDNAVHFLHHDVCDADIAMKNLGIVVGMTICYMKRRLNR